MSYFYLDSNQEKVGPYTEEELRQLHLSGVVKPDTQIVFDSQSTGVAFKEFWAKRRVTGPAESALSSARSVLGDFTSKTAEDLRTLTPHLLVPFQEMRTLRWLDNRPLLMIAAMGLFPLLILALFAQRGEMKTAYWALAFYFSVWWAMFFYHLFPATQIEFGTCLIAFFGTGLVSIGLLLPAYVIPPLSWFYKWTKSQGLIEQLLGYTFGVGVPEEACKALVLFFLLRRGGAMAPQTMLFYGLMSGLGFGIYEGVGYQMGRNVQSSGGHVDVYYLANLMRLTSLPFLHAIWTGIAGYFLAFAYLYPRRKRGLFVFGIGFPAVLHGIYDVFAVRQQTFMALLFALLSVMALYMYLAKSVDFEKVLGEQPGEKK